LRLPNAMPISGRPKARPHTSAGCLESFLDFPFLDSVAHVTTTTSDAAAQQPAACDCVEKKTARAGRGRSAAAAS